MCADCQAMSSDALCRLEVAGAKVELKRHEQGTRVFEPADAQRDLAGSGRSVAGIGKGSGIQQPGIRPHYRRSRTPSLALRCVQVFNGGFVDEALRRLKTHAP